MHPAAVIEFRASPSHLPPPPKKNATHTPCSSPLAPLSSLLTQHDVLQNMYWSQATAAGHMETSERILTAGSCKPSDGVAQASSVADNPNSGGDGSNSGTAAQTHSLRAGETVFYWSQDFTSGDLRGARFIKISAIRVLTTDVRPSPDGVLIEGRSKENSTSGTDATRIEIFFEGNVILDTDQGVQRYRDINGTKLQPKRRMLPLKEYRLIPSDAPAVRQG